MIYADIVHRSFLRENHVYDFYDCDLQKSCSLSLLDWWQRKVRRKISAREVMKKNYMYLSLSCTQKIYSIKWWWWMLIWAFLFDRSPSSVRPFPPFCCCLRDQGWGHRRPVLLSYLPRHPKNAPEFPTSKEVKITLGGGLALSFRSSSLPSFLGRPNPNLIDSLHFPSLL